ncbi:flavodoxin family protein [Streptomyces sp. NPDC006463]|uniref:flavodoxin family protein n=1 Tax=Streptomyces sp. NPDC006463 TaxID=3364746 RepID=UPI0036B0016A
MKKLIVCTSVSHGNSRKVADVMGRVLGARVVSAGEADAVTLAGCDLVGFGSGVFYGKLHPDLLRFVRSLPRGGYGRAFVFATSGLPEVPLRPFAGPLIQLLQEKGFVVTDSFSCRGFDTWGPFRLAGGINKRRPNATDLQTACEFAQRLCAPGGAVS